MMRQQQGDPASHASRLSAASTSLTSNVLRNVKGIRADLLDDSFGTRPIDPAAALHGDDAAVADDTGSGWDDATDFHEIEPTLHAADTSDAPSGAVGEDLHDVIERLERERMDDRRRIMDQEVH